MSRPAISPSHAATAAYAAGSFGTGVFSTVPTILLLYFCTEILALPAKWATAIVFVPKVWSIVWDPFVGAWSDQSTSALGRRRPFLIAGTLGVTVSFIAVFSPPAAGPAATACWVAAAYFLLATLYSLFAVPYVAIPAEVCGEREARARMVSWRMLVAMIGILTGAGLVPPIVAFAGGGRHGYAIMSLLVAGACAIAMLAPVLMMRGRDPQRRAASTRTPQPLLANLWSALGAPRFRALAIAYLLQLTAVGVISSATPYLVTRVFGRGEADIGTAMLAMLVVTTVTIPAWAWAGRRFGEARALVTAVVAYALLAAGLGLLAFVAAPWLAALSCYALLGAPFAAMQVLPYTMVAHLIHADSLLGHAAEGSFTGVWTATEKLGLALGPALTGLVLWLAAGPRAGSLAVLTMTAPAVLALGSVALLRRDEPTVPVVPSLAGGT